MQLTRSPKFDSKRAREIILKENKFITHLFSILPIPVSRREHDSKTDEEYLLPSSKPPLVSHGSDEKPSRASSLVDLQKRLEAVKAKRLTVKQKIDKKKLRNKIKKNKKKNERNAKKKLAKAVKNTVNGNLNDQKKENKESEKTSEATPAQPVFNKDASMVFSKIDFSEVGKKRKIKQKKAEKDPKMILKKLETQKKKIKELEEKGEVEKAVVTKQKEAWKSALAKAEGKKVKDDPLLLKKTVKKQEQIKRKSAKQWEQRKEKLEKAKEERQKKRQENIKKKKDKKKADKMKKAAKKGKIIL